MELFGALIQHFHYLVSFKDLEEDRGLAITSTPGCDNNLALVVFDRLYLHHRLYFNKVQLQETHLTE